MLPTPPPPPPPPSSSISHCHYRTLASRKERIIGPASTSYYHISYSYYIILYLTTLILTSYYTFPSRKKGIIGPASWRHIVLSYIRFILYNIIPYYIYININIKITTLLDVTSHYHILDSNYIMLYHTISISMSYIMPSPRGRRGSCSRAPRSGSPSPPPPVRLSQLLNLLWVLYYIFYISQQRTAHVWLAVTTTTCSTNLII